MPRTVTADDMIKCLRREISMRKRVYPRWVEQGKMDIEEAEWEKDVMREVLHFVLEKTGRKEPELFD